MDCLSLGLGVWPVGLGQSSVRQYKVLKEWFSIKNVVKAESQVITMTN